MSKPTIRQLAETYKVAKSTLEGWSQKGINIHSAPEVVAHILTLKNLPPNWKGIRADRSALDAARLRKVTLEGDRLQKQNDLYDGLYHPSKETEEAIKMIAVVDGMKDRAEESEFPSMLAGLDAHQIEKRVKEFNGEWTVRKKDAHSAVWEAARLAVLRETRGEMRKVVASRKGKNS